MKPEQKKKHKVLPILLTVFLILLVPGLDQRMMIRQYQLDSAQIQNPVRIVLITDLHSCRYGENQQNLIKAIDEQNPDIIALCGDIFDDVIPDINTETVIADISSKYPCYYVTGNHEPWAGQAGFLEKMQILDKYPVHVLHGEMETITINGEEINICGIDDPETYAVSPFSNETTEQQMKKLDVLCQNGNYSILLSHRPELFPDYENQHFDLVLCGHAHGGQWRIPYLLNGLYAPNQGLFPKYAGGEYHENDVTMIVSRGLARESTRVPRIYNRPELVVIDIS